MTHQYDHVDRATARPETGSGRHRVGGDLAVASVLLAVVAGVTGWLFDLPVTYFVASGLLWLGLAAIVAFRAPADGVGRGLGAANRITLGRAVLVLPACALAVRTDALSDGAAWWVVGLSTAGLILDGVDGYVARRTRTASAFGARFDMELDAFLMLGLSILVWLRGAVGAWVLLIGTLRYLFVFAGRIWPILRGELAASHRRKTICVVQGIALLVGLAPVVRGTLIGPVAAGALVLLVYSFAVDVRRLQRSSL